MLSLAEVLRQYWPQYERQFGSALLPSHRRAVQAILNCRTPALGGQVFRCVDCRRDHFVYHSCNHRACPQCGHADTTQWLERQRSRLLPVPYYMVTFTVPAQLRQTIRSNQKILYPLLLGQSAAALADIARDHKNFGAQIGACPCCKPGLATCVIIRTSIASSLRVASPLTAYVGFGPNAITISCLSRHWPCVCARA